MCKEKYKPIEEHFDVWKNLSSYIKDTFDKEEWLFRGLSTCDDLSTSLERAFDKWEISPDGYLQTEKYLIRDFQRRYILAKGHQPPDQEDTLAWLAMMQHYGAPTRLMDWTYSPYIATFFAAERYLKSKESQNKPLQEARDEKKPGVAIWAIRRTWFDVAAPSVVPEELLRKLKLNDISAFKILFIDASPRNSFVYPVIPYSLNERLIVQQGIFLCPGDLTKKFKKNLINMHGCQEAVNIKKITLSINNVDDLRKIFDDLLRMNIYRASLFPGMDGYAQSFATRLPLLYDLSKRYDL